MITFSIYIIAPNIILLAFSYILLFIYFLHNLNIVRISTKGIYTTKLFVYLRTGVY
jgi:dolichol kinase